MALLRGALLFICLFEICKCSKKGATCENNAPVQSAENTEFLEKWMATIHRTPRSNRGICLGVFLHERVVLTQASCIDMRNSRHSHPPELLVVSNDWQEWKPDKVVIHHGFKVGHPENDIALLALPKTAEPKKHKIICLPLSYVASEILTIEWEGSSSLSNETEMKDGCEYQDNVDYFDGDIPAAWPLKKVDTPEECCEVCRNFSACEVWSWGKPWDSFHGKKCFLKTAVGTKPFRDEDRVSGSPRKKISTTCVYQDGIDYYGNDMGVFVTVGSAAECCAKCQATFYCIAWTYASKTDDMFSKGSCWRKYAVPNHPSKNSKRISGILEATYLEAHKLDSSKLWSCNPSHLCRTNRPDGNRTNEALAQMFIGKYNQSTTWTVQGIGMNNRFQNLIPFVPWITDMIDFLTRDPTTTTTTTMEPSGSDNKWLWIATSITAGGFLIVCIILAIVFCKKHRRSSNDLIGPGRIHFDQVLLVKKIGEGHFCHVWQGKLRTGGNEILVAIKALKLTASEREQKQFLEEAHILSKLHRHKNIVTAIGLCLDRRPNMLVMEYMNGGSLLQFLKRDETRLYLGYKQMMKICIDICSACFFLEEKGYIHRDISARNCLVHSGNRAKVVCAKLSDFGLAKDGSEYQSAAPELPVAWTGPEGFQGKFCIKSDVWSFGVLVWEVFSWGSSPYGMCSYPICLHRCPLYVHSIDEIQNLVCTQGKTLLDFQDPCCSKFPDTIRHLMKKCWDNDCNQRPTFKQIKLFLELEREKDLVTSFGVELDPEVNHVIDMQSIPQDAAGYISVGAQGQFRCIDPYASNMGMSMSDPSTSSTIASSQEEVFC